jgi:hypothetical protein
MLTTSADLDTKSVTSLQLDLKRKNGIPMKIQMDMRVKVFSEGCRARRPRRAIREAPYFFGLIWVGLDFGEKEEEGGRGWPIHPMEATPCLNWGERRIGNKVFWFYFLNLFHTEVSYVYWWATNGDFLEL